MKILDKHSSGETGKRKTPGKGCYRNERKESI